jgi:5-methyltetrahydrofolate--homocysteine methyltransferase
MTAFLEALHSGRILLMDGAMGTELQRAGMAAGTCPELWNLLHPDRVLAIHQAYVEAGADCVLTNTFQANETALARYGLAGRLDSIIHAALALARTAAGAKRFVIGDIGPVENPSPDSARGLIQAFATADAILLETWSDVPSAELFLDAACKQPVLISFTFEHANQRGDIRTFKGFSPEACARAAQGHGASAVGVNCGKDLAMEDLAAILHRYRTVTDLPLFARPNAGTPARSGNGWVYPYQPNDMAALLPRLLVAGAVMIGGCCGTTPQTIAAFRAGCGEPVTEAGELGA